MTRSTLIASATSLLFAAGAAQAQFFSFASDTDAASWTFTYDPQTGTITDADDSADPVVLLIDDRNGPAAAAGVSAEFEADFTIAAQAAVPLSGSDFLHIYTVNGSFEFLVDVGAGLQTAMRIDFRDATLTARGSRDQWYSTATIAGGDSVDNDTRVSYSFFQPLLDSVPNAAELGLAVGTSVGPDDFSFDLTSINTSGLVPFDPATDPDSVGVPTGGAGQLPTDVFWSEGSFSGSAVIPSPGAAALLGLGGLAAARRRR